MSHTVGIFMPAGIGVQAEPVFIGDYTDIQKNVGGNFDVVTVKTVGNDGSDVVLCGYVHDEGLLLDLDINWLASALFSREIHGDVVVMWALSPNGVYDGDNHDMPAKVQKYLLETHTEIVAERYNQAAVINMMFMNAVEEGFVEMCQLEAFDRELERTIATGDALSDEATAFMQKVLEWSINQAVANGLDDDDIDDIVDIETSNMDDVIEKLLSEGDK